MGNYFSTITMQLQVAFVSATAIVVLLIYCVAVEEREQQQLQEFYVSIQSASKKETLEKSQAFKQNRNGDKWTTKNESKLKENREGRRQVRRFNLVISKTSIEICQSYLGAQM